MERLIYDIIAKVRSMYKYDRTINGIVGQDARVKLIERNGRLELDSIEFYYYDKVIVSRTEITYHPEFGCSQTLITYKGFNNLLEL